MPKTPQDFSKGLIYTIVCKTDETLLYVGSTTNFTQRKNTHKGACCNENSKKYNRPVYVMMRANGGWDSFNMRPVKEFPCESKIQLVIEEERIRKEMQANLNTRKAFLSPEERKEQIKEWRKDNAEHVNQYNKDNAEHIAERKKQYQKVNTERIAEYMKQYNKVYRKVNSAKISERKKLKRQELKNAL
jgi:hypothetical protein